ncbi:MAG: hypothetical protein KAY70_01455 [Acetobacterium sp.]|uniref:hypothetical protein n=1 Tax=Acetobacterium sp. MES1 TaxID=1899015 RepID=UPI000B9C7A44|nr:hypothetical protein [Acetobacterium sp. MES1]MBP8031158.1 hypothetical protein [Acetobacterium sp.]OXS25689.1 MAG: hypothetical protein BI182_00580 [Acetobacterium sp. MES1]
MCALSDKFIKDLQQGVLKNLLEEVKMDDNLCLAIRENYINIYYRGGNLFKIASQGNGYKIFFDINYFNHKQTVQSNFATNFNKNGTIEEYIQSIPLLKREMDLYFYENNKLEREYQQIVLRENNNSSISNDTDYYIADIESSNTDNGSRFDLIGIKWASTGPARRTAKDISLVLMEMKYGDGAHAGSAGIIKHFEDIEKFAKSGKISALMVDTQTKFNQLVELGLINNVNKQILINTEIKPEFILLLANHKAASTILHRELREAIKKCPDIEEKVSIKIATSSYMGYGLYISQMIDLADFLANGIVIE